MQVLKQAFAQGLSQGFTQRIWSSLNDADAWVLGIGVLSCLGLATGVLG